MNLHFKKAFQVLMTVVAIAAVCIVYARNTTSPSGDLYFNNLDDTFQTKDSASLAKEKADSLASYRSYLRSKRYNDSVDAWRKHRMDSIRTANQHKLDSIKAERQRRTDSAEQVRIRKNDSLQTYIEAKKIEQQRYVDSISAVRQSIIDSMDALKKYRNSRTYKDSVKAVQKAKVDSIKAKKQLYMDSLAQVRQLYMDSLMVARERQSDSLNKYLDSVKEARTQKIDSMKSALQSRLDSLEKVKEAREEELDKKQEDRLAQEKKKRMEKLQKERDAYTNEKFLKKKWSFFRQILQNTTTRYNYYFNAKNKIKEAEDNMYRSKVDNLDSFITLLPFDPNTDSARFKNDMDSLIQRIAVGIQIHDPRVKWQDDLYLILGKSFYYKGDYNNAAASFQFIVSSAIQEEKKLQLKENKKSKHPDKVDLISIEDKGWLQHKPVKNDAVIWMARVYIQQGDFVKAQTLLDMVQSSKNLTPRLKGELEESYARFYLAQGIPEMALPYLDSVAFRKDLDPQLRYRAGFLAGQIYQSKSNFTAADRMYAQVIRLHPPVEIDFKASINQLIARSGIESGNLDQTIKTFKSLTKEQKYAPYYDQVYYELAKLQQQNQQYDEALINYRTSTTYSKNNNRQKGLSYYEMGNIYYQQNKYVEAKSAFDSALNFLTIHDQPQQGIAIKLGSGLTKIATPGNTVQWIDSVLQLTSLSEHDKKEWAKEELKRREEAKRWQELQGSTNPTLQANNPTGEWYFLNEGLASKGELEFKTKWGSRPLKDNWRRSSGSFGSSNDIVNTDNSTEEKELTIQDLLDMIPSQPKTIDSLHQALQKACFQLGLAFMEAEDDVNAKFTFETLLQKYPSFNPKEEVLYQQYLLALRQNDINEAQSLKSQIIKDYPNSEVAKTLQAAGNKTIENSAVDNEKGIQQHLDETYRMLKLGLFKDVLVRTEEVKTLFPIHAPQYMNKYGLMKAIATAGTGDYPKADTMLTEIIKINSNDSLTQWAKDVQYYIRKNMLMIQPKTKPNTSDASFLDPSVMNKNYEYTPATKHYFVAYTRKYDGRFKGLKAGVVDYNALKKSAEGLITELTEINSNEALFVVKEFDNAPLAKAYLNSIRKEAQLLQSYALPSDVTYMIISEENFTLLLLTKKIPEYLNFYYKNYK